LAIFFCIGVSSGFARSAFAKCPPLHPKANSGHSLNPKCRRPPPSPPRHFSGTIFNAEVAGLANAESQTVNSNVTSQNPSLLPFPTKLNAATRTLEIWLPNGYVKIHGYTQNGVNFAKVSMGAYELSSSIGGSPHPRLHFADFASFTLKKNGSSSLMTSGSWGRFNQMRLEISFDMPGRSLWGRWWNDTKHWWHHHKRKVKDCAMTAGYISSVALVSAGGAALGGPAGAAFGATIVTTVGSRVFRKAQDNCFKGLPDPWEFRRPLSIPR
jgi:hypothetical protein